MVMPGTPPIMLLGATPRHVVPLREVASVVLEGGTSDPAGRNKYSQSGEDIHADRLFLFSFFACILCPSQQQRMNIDETDEP